jgi:uncharacterized membrane protein YfbV (UPF0208 family)
MDKIPIKGYASFHPLKHCWIGSGFRAEWFDDLFPKNKKISDPLKRIANEAEEDYQQLEKILQSAGVKTHRSFLNIEKYKSLHEIYKPPVTPRDHFAVIGKKIYSVGASCDVYNNVLERIDKKNLIIQRAAGESGINTATIVRVGKDLFWDIHKDVEEHIIIKYKNLWEQEGFRVHVSSRGYHSDGAFCVVKPGCIVSLCNIQDYKKTFPGWDILYLPDLTRANVFPFIEMKKKVKGRWWINGEENNDQLIEFIDNWLTDWVGYVEETVFDVNMLSIDENTIICNNYNKEVFNFFKKHKVEPIIFNFRHRYFWDGGVHCITQDLYREGKMEDYFG